MVCGVDEIAAVAGAPVGLPLSTAHLYGTTVALEPPTLEAADEEDRKRFGAGAAASVTGGGAGAGAAALPKNLMPSGLIECA